MSWNFHGISVANTIAAWIRHDRFAIRRASQVIPRPGWGRCQHVRAVVDRLGLARIVCADGGARCLAEYRGCAALCAYHVANRWIGEAMSFIAGSSYASFERIRHMHIRHHLDRADLTCFDFKGLMRRRPAIRRALQGLEWAYIPATEVLMHLQVIWRPFVQRSQR